MGAIPHHTKREDGRFMAAAANSGGRWWRSLFLVLLLLAMTGEAWAATGAVTISGPVPGPEGIYEATGDFSVAGTYTMSEDETPRGDGIWEPCTKNYPGLNGRARFSPDYFDTVQWEGIYATLNSGVDGKPGVEISQLEYWYGPNPHSDLGETKTFSARVSVSGLPARPFHTVTVYLEDLFSVWCYKGAVKTDGPFRETGDIFASATLMFRTPTDIPPFVLDKNLGDPNASCPHLGTSNPVNLATGNKYVREDDFSVASLGGNLSFSRAYNSQSTYDGPLGYGWTHSYNVKLDVLDETTLRIMKRDGRCTIFVKANESLYRGTGNEYARVSRVPEGYILREGDGSRWVFDADGTLIRIEDRHGNGTFLTYNGGILISVQDGGSGRTLTFTYTDGKIAAVTGPATPGNPAGVLVTFSYANGNLTGVTYPDGESFLYFYEDGNDPHNLTRKTKGDGLTVLKEAVYDAKDRAIRSALHGGSEAVTVSYGLWETAVTDSLGRRKVYKFDVIDGIAVPLERDGGGCSECANRYEYGPATATALEELGDDFTGPDGSPPAPSRWTTVAGSPEIRGERLWLDGTASDQVIELSEPITSDFDAQVDFQVDTGPLANSWSFFVHAVSGEKVIGTRFGVYGSQDRYWLTYYDGSWHDTHIMGFGHGSMTSGKLRLTRTGNLFRFYVWMFNSRWQKASQEIQFLAPYEAVTLRVGLMRWGENPQPTGYLDNFKLFRGELSPPETFHLLSATNGNGVTTRYEDYDLAGNARRVIEAWGMPEEKRTTYTYHPDLRGEPLTIARQSVLNPDGERVTIFDYDNDGNEIPNEEPTTRVSRILEQGYTWDGSGGFQEFSHEKRFTYNARGQVATVDGPRPGTADTVSYTYYENGDLRSIIRPNGGTVFFDDYDALGRVGRMMDENGHETTYTYDARGRLTSITTEAGTTSITRTDLGATGRSEVVASPNGTSLRSTYDVNGKLVDLSDSLGEPDPLHLRQRGEPGLGAHLRGDRGAQPEHPVPVR
jgi:YD repeat-containing protein